MEQNNLQTGRQEAGLTAVLSCSIVASSVQKDGAAGNTSGGWAAANSGSSASANGSASATAIGGAAIAPTTGGATGGGASAANGGGAATANDGAGAIAGASAAAPAGSSVGATGVGPSKKRRIHRHTQEQINALETYFMEDARPNGLKRNELAQTLGMEPFQVLCWFQNKRTQMRSQSKRKETEAIRSENDVLRAQIQHSAEVLSKNICPECGASISQQSESVEENILRSENIRLREEVEQLRSAVTIYIARQDPQNLPIAFQDSQYPSMFQNPHNLPTRTQNLISQTPQNLAIHEQNPQNLQIISKSTRPSHTG